MKSCPINHKHKVNLVENYTFSYYFCETCREDVIHLKKISEDKNISNRHSGCPLIDPGNYKSISLTKDPADLTQEELNEILSWQKLKAV